ncbi:MAG: FG-GAP-like repeat-containing protein [Planctomycetota bacterium]
MPKSLAPIFLLLFLPNDLFGQIYQWDGATTYDRMGESVSSAGDVNGDGFDDVIVGAAYAQIIGPGEVGSAFVYSGADGSVLFQWNGQVSSDRFGVSVSSAGDVNGDGIVDFIVGADSTGNNGLSSGSAYVYSGADGSLLYQWDGGNAFDRFGWPVSGAGDVNGDGFDDLIVGARYSDDGGLNGGSAYLFSGANGSLFYQWDGAASASFGASVSAAGDVNGDGFDDVIVGATGTGSGSAYVYSGANGSLLYQWNGQSANDRFGYSVSGAGDVNGDGFADLVVGALFATAISSGSAYVYSGTNGSMLYQWDGQALGNRFGNSVSSAGDVNGDGFDDVIVGANGTDNHGIDSGTAYVYSGAYGSLLHQWEGQNADDQFGHCVSGAGDVNGDGFENVIVGANFASNNGTDSGSAYVYSVSAAYSITPMTAGSPATFMITGATPNSSVTLGYSLLGAGPFTTAFGVVAMTPPIHILSVLATNANGDASLTLNVPGSVAGRTLYTQGLDSGFLTTSLAAFIN